MFLSVRKILTNPEAVFRTAHHYLYRQRPRSMIKILQIKIVGLLATGNILLAGCIDKYDDSIYVSQDGTTAYYPTLGTVEDTEPITVASDTYGTLIPTNPEVFEKNRADSIGQRVFLNVVFSPDTDKSNSGKREVMVLNLYSVPTFTAIDLRKAGDTLPDTFGNDPVQITGASISKEHLNIEFNFKGSGNTHTHGFSLLLTKDAQLDNQGILPVELRHDAKSDTPTGWYWGVTSFTLKSIPEYQQGTFKGFSIKYNSGANSQAVWVVKKSS